MKRFDVAIIGGGPAGSSLALSLRQRGLSVLIVERTNYQEWRSGETLSPHARIPLSRLGVMENLRDASHLASEATRSAWGSSELVEKHSVFNPYGSGWHLDRSKFDEALASAANKFGATVMRGVSFISALHSDPWQITLKNGSGLLQVEAKFVVDATGRAAQVAKSLGSKMIFHDHLVAMIGIVSPNSSECPVESMLTVEARQEGWWYSAPLPDGRVLATFMTDNDIFLNSRENPTSFWVRMLKATEHLSILLDKFQLIDKVRMRNASTCKLDRVVGTSWLAVGDAACAFDPLAGNGIFKALQSGIDSSEGILPNESNGQNDLQLYADKIVATFNEYLRARQRYYQKEQRWSDSPFWRRRHLSIVE
jgi:flavin-dependent dehydrogenase